MYKVRNEIDCWAVYSVTGRSEDDCYDETETHFHGSLADCEAWIRLTEQDRM
jgi:hypothetical protein